MVHSANNNSLIDFEKLPIADRYCVAFSGGVDSTALLIAASEVVSIKHKLFAVHVNHQIQSESLDWASHCGKICEQLGVPLITKAVQLESHSENACRQARIKVFKSILTESDCLLTAHHANDQAETILFRFLRGTGIFGLKGMAKTNQLFGYQNHRPFLSLSKIDLIKFVEAKGVKHISDPSNSDTTYSRNYIRNKIIPEIQRYNDDALQNIIHTARNINNSNRLLNHLIGTENPFSIQTFNNLELLTTALYHWLKNLTSNVVASQKQMIQFANDCLNSAKDKNVQLDLGTIKLIKWKSHVFALNPLPIVDFTTKNYQLRSNQTLLIPTGSILIKSKSHLCLDITIAYQNGSQNIDLPNHNFSKKVKNLFQENEIPPWVRQYVPYIYIDNELMSIGSLFISKSFKQYLDSNNAQFEWLSPQFLL